MKEKRNTQIIYGIYLILTVLVIAAIVGCTTASTSADSETHEDAHRHNYGIELAAGHAHIMRESELVFTVRNLDQCSDPEDSTTCEQVAGLPVIAFYQSPTSSRVREQAVEEGVLEDNGDGTYTWKRAFNDLGAHMVGLKFEDDEQHYFGAFPLETSKAGGERYFCDADSDGVNDFAYQIRWSSSRGHIHAEHDPEDVTFSIEVMRSFNDTLNEERPWQNSFDHLSPDQLNNQAPTVELMAGEGTDATAIATLTPTYKGRGIYDVAYAFEEPNTYWLRVNFTDNQDCSVDGAGDAEEYLFSVVPGH